MTRKFAAELVDVYRFIIAVGFGIAESLFRHKVHNVAIVVDADHGAVHPRFVLGHEGQIGARVVENEGEHAIVENQVAFDEQSVVLLQLLFGQCQRIDVVGFIVDGIIDVFNAQHIVVAVANVVTQPLSFVADHDYHAL